MEAWFGSEDPKEAFKVVLDIFQKFLDTTYPAGLPRPLRFMDLGCATGEFLDLVRSKWPDALLYGVDSCQEFLDLAKSRLDPHSSVELINCDILAIDPDQFEPFDLVTCLGTLSTMDDFSVLFDVMLGLARGIHSKKHAGLGIVDNTFIDSEVHLESRVLWRVPKDVDVRIAHEHSIEHEWQHGFNSFSEKSVGDFLRGRGCDFCFVDFRFTKPLKRVASADLRAYTVALADKSEYLLRNDLGLIVNSRFVSFSLRERIGDI